MRRWEDDIKRLQGVGRGRSEVNLPPLKKFEATLEI